ncbi:MAG: M23 family metallopeptidase [Gemmatimonadetes bacterium]|nr:M23 family metallopeptidase [Gemmatimonadota bacterium]
MAAGDGTVRTAGWSGGSGKMIEILHRNGITIRYAHLRGYARGIRPGGRVTQGSVVGYVGSSGLATSAHLYYEFRQNGAARDPSRVELGTGEPVPVASRAAFLAERDRLRSLLFPSNPVSAAVAADRD